jgi:hypothetical protein
MKIDITFDEINEKIYKEIFNNLIDTEKELRNKNYLQAAQKCKISMQKLYYYADKVKNII